MFVWLRCKGKRVINVDPNISSRYSCIWCDWFEVLSARRSPSDGSGSLEEGPCSRIMLCKSHGKVWESTNDLGIYVTRVREIKSSKHQLIRVVIYHVVNEYKRTNMFVTGACE